MQWNNLLIVSGKWWHGKWHLMHVCKNCTNTWGRGMGCMQVTHLILLTNTRFYIQNVRMNEPLWKAADGYMMSNRFQRTQDGNLVKVFFLMKRQTDKCYIRPVRQFLFSTSPDVPVFNVCVFKNDYLFWITVNEYQ